jgi:hypothetical protein
VSRQNRATITAHVKTAQQKQRIAKTAHSKNSALHKQRITKTAPVKTAHFL